MELFTIADLHLSTAEQTDKPMEVFGRRWDHYLSKIEKNWHAIVSNEDTVMIPGDISWALSLEESLSDLKFLDGLPGKKILLKGNHDFWWTTMKKHGDFFEKNGIRTISFLYNNAVETEKFILAGSRGWYAEADGAINLQNAPDFDKITAREAGRLKTSLEAAMKIRETAPEKEILVFTHFPPFWNGKPSGKIFDVLKEYPIRRTFFGHIHGNYTLPSVFRLDGIDSYLIAADYLDFIPKKILAE